MPRCGGRLKHSRAMKRRLKRAFGVDVQGTFARSLVVLDKSFLQGVTAQELRFYVKHGWIFGVTEILQYEHFRKWDRWRFANLVKLKAIEKHIVLLPGIGEMFRAESKKRKPASQVLRIKGIVLTDKLIPGRPFFELDEGTKKIATERTVELEKRLDILIDVWTDFKKIPEFDGAKSEDMAAIVRAKSLQIRDDHDDMRGFYKRHRHRSQPPAKLIDEEWTFFRWIQVQLLAGLDFFASHGLGAPFNRENLFHGLLDLDYLIVALVVGGLASREQQMLERFSLLRPDGLIELLSNVVDWPVMIRRPPLVRSRLTE